ncbi:MAG: KH domain-containing protein [Desulfosarcinaceae bacterium]|jgi:predicted RNA-binding protein YlqC (UPF0109 family)
MIEFTRRIVHALVDSPEKVVVTAVSGDRTTILKISAGPGEAGKIIGKHGRTAGALRTLLKVAAAKEKRHVILEIADSQPLIHNMGPVKAVVRRPFRHSARACGHKAAS